MNEKGGLVFIIIIVLAVVIIGGSISYFVISGKSGNGGTLSADICVYDSEKYLTCGTSYTLVSEGVEHDIIANEPFHFPQGESKLIGLVDSTKPEGERTFLVFLEEGGYSINEETSRRAVGRLIAR